MSTTDADVLAIGGNASPRTNLIRAPRPLAATHPAADCTLINGLFVAAPYLSAFAPGGLDWTAGWTAYP